MQPTDRYRLESHPGPYESWPRTTRLIVDGELTEHTVSGYVIDAQYHCPLGTLLITSYDCLFEEANSFILLNDEHRIIAKRFLGAMYDSFLLDAHWPIDEFTIALHYQTTLFYTLSVLPPLAYFGRRPRLKLLPCLTWRSDERMMNSYRALEQSLQEIKQTLAKEHSTVDRTTQR